MVQLVYLLPAPLFGIFTAFLEWVAFHHRQISRRQRWHPVTRLCTKSKKTDIAVPSVAALGDWWTCFFHLSKPKHIRWFFFMAICCRIRWFEETEKNLLVVLDLNLFDMLFRWARHHWLRFEHGPWEVFSPSGWGCWGLLELQLQAKQGQIVAAKIYGPANISGPGLIMVQSKYDMVQICSNMVQLLSRLICFQIECLFSTWLF